MQRSMSYFTEILGNFSWMILEKLVKMALGFFVSILLARSYGVELFGEFNFALSLIVIATTISGLGLQGIAVKKIVLEPERQARTVTACFMLILFAGSILYASIVTFSEHLSNSSATLKASIVLLGAMLLLKPFDAISFWFEAKTRLRYIIIPQAVMFTIFSIMKIYMIFNAFNFSAIVVVTLVEAAFGSALLLVLWWAQGPKAKFSLPNFDCLVGMLTESWPMLLSGIAVVLYMKSDQVMLGQLLGNSSVGIYSAALKFSELWYFVPIAAITSFFPYLLRIREIDNVQYYKKIQQLLDIFSVFSVLIVLVLTLAGEFIISISFGANYLAAAPILSIHAWTIFFVSFGAITGRWLIAEGLQRLHFARTLSGLIINILLNYILIPEFREIGAALATLVSQIVANFLFDLATPMGRKMLLMKISSLNLVRSIRSIIAITTVLKSRNLM